MFFKVLIQIRLANEHLVADIDDTYRMHKKQSFAAPTAKKLRKIAPPQIRLSINVCIIHRPLPLRQSKLAGPP